MIGILWDFTNFGIQTLGFNPQPTFLGAYRGMVCFFFHPNCWQTLLFEPRGQPRWPKHQGTWLVDQTPQLMVYLGEIHPKKRRISAGSPRIWLPRWIWRILRKEMHTLFCSHLFATIFPRFQVPEMVGDFLKPLMSGRTPCFVFQKKIAWFWGCRLSRFPLPQALGLRHLEVGV